jgi:hypothetical protein
MQPTRIRRPVLQASLAAAAAALLIVAACEAPSPKVLAPDGQDHDAVRLMGKTSLARVVPDSVASLVAKYFPEAKRGFGKPSMLFIVRDAQGRVLRTTRADAPEQVRDMIKDDRPLTADRVRTMETTPMKIVSDKAPAGAPAALSDIRPDRIATVDVTKHAAGVFGPDAVSVIVVTLKS